MPAKYSTSKLSKSSFLNLTIKQYYILIMSEIAVDSLGADNGDDETVVPFTEPSVSPIAGIQGEFGGQDVKFPYLSIIHGVGSSFAKFPKNTGDLLYNGETLVDRPVELSFYGVEKLYVQNLRFDPQGPRPNIFKTTQQVLAAGGNLKEYVTAGSDDQNYIPNAVCHVALFAPKPTKKGEKSWANGLDLAIPDGDETLVPAIWTLRGTAYRTIVPQLIMADSRLRKEKKTLAHQRWTLDTKHVKMGANFVYVPVFSKVAELNSDETLALFDENFGG